MITHYSLVTHLSIDQTLEKHQLHINYCVKFINIFHFFCAELTFGSLVPGDVMFF